jgi:hypothetical protein
MQQPQRQQPPAMQQPQRPLPPVMQPRQPQPLPMNPQPQQGPGLQKPQGDRQVQSGGGQSDNKGKGEARSLLNDLKLKNLPGVQGRLESARKRPGVKLDYAALSRQLDAARSAIAAAENTLSTGKSDAALQQAQGVQRQLADLDRHISDAMASPGGVDPGDQVQRQGDAPGNKR